MSIEAEDNPDVGVLLEEVFRLADALVDDFSPAYVDRAKSGREIVYVEWHIFKKLIAAVEAVHNKREVVPDD